MVNDSGTIELAYPDLYSTMYTPVGDLAAFAKKQRPLPADKRRTAVLCEYSHAMGNSSGNLADYWDLIRGNLTCKADSFGIGGIRL